MRQHRVIALAAAAALAVAGQSLTGRAAQPASAHPETPFDHLHFRSIGPAGMSGRIADIAVYEANPNIFYVGAAHGGVWKMTNGGTTFDDQLQQASRAQDDERAGGVVLPAQADGRPVLNPVPRMSLETAPQGVMPGGGVLPVASQIPVAPPRSPTAPPGGVAVPGMIVPAPKPPRPGS